MSNTKPFQRPTTTKHDEAWQLIKDHTHRDFLATEPGKTAWMPHLDLVALLFPDEAPSTCIVNVTWLDDNDLDIVLEYYNNK